MSGEKVSKDKTQIYLSKEIGEITGFSVSKNLGKYLRMQLLHNQVTNNTYQEVLDQVDKRS